MRMSDHEEIGQETLIAIINELLSNREDSSWIFSISRHSLYDTHFNASLESYPKSEFE